MSDNLGIDLFGDLCTLPSGRRGRPAHRWSVENQNRVTMGLALGYVDAEIAAGLGISLPTLRKYYFSVLKLRQMQRTRFELWRATTLAAQAADGNVGAMKELDKLMVRRDQHFAELAFKGNDNVQATVLGKKEQARLDADEAALDPDLKPGFGAH